MNIHVLPDAALVAENAAAHIAELLRQAVAERGRATLALSGGSTPRSMLHELATVKTVPWEHVTVLQVDERVAPDDDASRNLTMITDAFINPLLAAGVTPPVVVPMDVGAGDAEAALSGYQQLLDEMASLDVVQLGLGSDGHTASLVPGDPILTNTNASAGVTLPYQGTVRVSLTAPTIAAARSRVWIIAGAQKAVAVAQLVAADPAIPAILVCQPDDVVFLDASAAALL